MHILIQNEDEQSLIHKRLFSEIELGIFKESTRNELLGIIERMVNDEKIDSIIHYESIISFCLNQA